MRFGGLGHWRLSGDDVSLRMDDANCEAEIIALPGTLARVLILPGSPLLVLQGGGKEPLYPPNKAVIYHDGLGCPVAELEFGSAGSISMSRRS